MSTIDYCLPLTTITNADAGREGEWTVGLITGDITPVMPFGADSIYFDMQWCMHPNTLGLG